MKKIFFILIITTAAGFIASCKKENTEPTVEDKKTVCYTVRDSISHTALQGVYVSTVYDRNGFPLSYSGTTNASGEFCFETFLDAYESDLVASKSGYVNFCIGAHILTVYLTPVAYLQLHVKNISPVDSSDSIFITYPGTDCNGTSVLDYWGAGVDTTVVVEANQAANSLSWTSWHNSISTDSTHNGLSMSSHDTTFFELLY